MNDRELDALVAEWVMGWRLDADLVALGLIYIAPNGSHRLPDELPRYSTDIAAAWAVVERMQERGFWCQMRTPFGRDTLNDGCWAGFTPHGISGWNGTPDNWTDAPTAPRAICLAALRAVSVEVPDA